MLTRLFVSLSFDVTEIVILKRNTEIKKNIVISATV